MKVWTNMFKVVVTAATFLTVSLAAAAAQDSYVGISAGQGTSPDTDLCANASAGDTCSPKAKGTGFKLYGGWQFSDNIAVEFGIAKFGDVSSRSVAGAEDTTPATVTAKHKYSVSAAAALSFPFDDFSAFGKVGVHWFSANTVTAGFSPSGLNKTISGSGVGFVGGLGMQYRFSDDMAVRLEYEQYTLKKEHFSPGKVGLLSAGVVLLF